MQGTERVDGPKLYYKYQNEFATIFFPILQTDIK